MRRRRAHRALTTLGSQIVASLVSFQAHAETPEPPHAFEVRPRAPLVMLAAPRPALSVPAVDVLPAGLAPIASPPLPALAPHLAPSATPRDADAQMRQRRWFGFVTGGVGLVGLGFGATTSVLAAKKEALDRQCADPIRICSPDGKALTGGGSRAALSAAGLLVGLAGLSTGAYLVISSNRRTGSQTAIGADAYKRGAGLNVSRYW